MEQKTEKLSEEDIYNNFIDLFSDDDKSKLKALKDKKEWILDKFYIPFSLSYQGEDGDEDDMDILFNSALPFRKLTVNNPAFIKRVNLFNQKFRLCRMYKSLPTRTDDDVFYAEIDFKKLDKEDYKNLVAAFFYCLPKKIVEKDFQPDDIKNILKSALLGTKNEAVIILDKSHLVKGMYKLEGFTKLYTYSDMNEKEENLLIKIAKHLNIRTVMVHV